MLLLATTVLYVGCDQECGNEQCGFGQSVAPARVLLQRDLASRDNMLLMAAEDEGVMHAAFGNPFNASKALGSLMAMGRNSSVVMSPQLKDLMDMLVLLVQQLKAAEGFQESLAEAQKQINESVKEVHTFHEHVKQTKSDADVSDEELVSCVQSEVDLLKQLKACEDDMKKHNGTDSEECRKKEDARPFEVNLTGSCDLGNKDCAAMLSKIQEDLRAAEAILATRKRQFSDLEAACNTTIAKEKQLKEECSNKSASLAEKVQDCISDERTADLAKCSYGSGAQELCDAFKRYQASVYDMKKSNTKRQQTFATLETLECILKSFQKSGKLTDAANKECADKVDYAKQVGILNTMEDKIDNCTEVCSSSTASFSGFTWQIPSPRGVKASPEDYIKSADAPAITLTPLGSSPFAECSSSP